MEPRVPRDRRLSIDCPAANTSMPAYPLSALLLHDRRWSTQQIPRQRYIDAAQLERLAEPLKQNDYGQYLPRLLQDPG